jgi:hypothetical protein
MSKKKNGDASSKVGQLPPEGEIRDFFAANLQLVEPGLTLRKREAVLPNRGGAGGKVDILARDPSGQVVVIEIKKSNKTARETVQELHKYTALLQSEEGRKPHEIRCIVLSTDWDELLTPFSSWVREVQYPSVGFRIIPTADGGYTLSPMALSADPEPARLHQFPDRVLVSDDALRRKYLRAIRNKLKKIPEASGVLIPLDYEGQEPAIKLRVGFVLALWKVSDAVIGRLMAEGAIPFGELEPYADPEWAAEDDISTWLLSDACKDLRSGRCEMQQTTREQISWLLSSGWRSGSVARFGQFASSKEAWEDDEIIGLFTSTTRYDLDLTIAPKHRVAWKEGCADILEAVSFAPEWRAEVERFLHAVPQNVESAIVSATVFNPQHLPYALFHAAQGNPDLFPYFVIASAPVAGGIDGPALIGYVSWDGITSPPSAKAMFNEIYGGVESFVWVLFAAKDRTDYSHAYAFHGMKFQTVTARAYFDPEVRKARLLPNQGQQGGATHPRAAEILNSNPGYARELVDLIKGVIPDL